MRTCEDIVQASVVGEYVGEIIDQKELARRLKSIPRVGYERGRCDDQCVSG